MANLVVVRTDQGLVVEAQDANGVFSPTPPGTIIHSSALAPSNSQGTDGDYHLNTATADLYKRTDGVYSIVANIQGTAGNHGSVWRTGAGVPSNSLGLDGDFYLRTSNGDVYQRASGTYSVSANVTGPTGPSGGASAFSEFFGLTAGTGNGGPTDYAATVAVKTSVGTGRVPFPQAGLTSGAGAPVAFDSSSFTLPAVGKYKVTFKVHTTEPGQLQIELDGVDIAKSVTQDFNPTSGGHLLVGSCLVSTSLTNRKLAIVNCAGNAAALTITPADGSLTHANAQSIIIEQIA